MEDQWIDSINETPAPDLEPTSETTLQITLENLAPEAGTGIAQYWFAFQDGSFDLFNAGETASPQLELLAEDGIVGFDLQIPDLVESAVALGFNLDIIQPGLQALFDAGFDFSQLQLPNSTVAGLFEKSSAGINGGIQQAIIVPNRPPFFIALPPGETVSTTVTLEGDSANNRFFSYAAMLFPTNDGFIGNDEPIEIFDEAGNFIGADFIVSGSEVLDAGTEVNDEDPANLPYTIDVVGNSIDENGTIQPYPVFLPPGEGGVLDFEVDGKKVFANADFTVPDYQIARITITAVDKPLIPELNLNPETQLVTVDDPTPSISVLWDRAVQQAVINTAPGPTIASRAYAIVHTAIFDAWAAYAPTAIATQLGDDLQRPEAEITEANKEEAMSFAAYRVLTELFPDQVDIFNELMAELGFDPNNTTTDTTTAAGIGNVSAEALMEFRLEDGSNQAGNHPNGTLGVPYSDISGYEPVNPPGDPIDIERWTPELVPIDAEPGDKDSIQEFLTSYWGDVTPFALESGSQFRPEAPEPFLLVEGEVNLEARTITLADTESVVPITKDLIGNVINPEFIEQAEKIVDISANLTDEQKLIAEFWEDSSGTSFPPGTWMTFGQFVSARDDNTLDEDAQLFLALGNAVFDAGIATWEAKTFYDYTRPVRAVRELGELGLIGQFNLELGGFAIDAWKSPGEGTQTILATDFLTYQTPGSHPSPPFAEYTSGHSAFSAAGAEILQLFTGSDEFGGTVTFEPGESRFEHGVTPVETVTLEWDTFTEAADEAGISRIYGGIHFEDGDLNGRQLGREVGQTVWEQAQFFIQGGEEAKPIISNLPIFGTSEDDIFDAADNRDDFNGNRNLVFAGAGNDLVDASQALIGQNRIYGGTGNDELLAGAGDRLFGEEGDDILDASVGSGDNRLYGQTGNDTFFGGSGDRFYGGEGDDVFFVTDGGNNLFTGEEGSDAFWIATGELVTEANIITDFELDEDVIGVAGLGISSTEELAFEQIGDDTAISFSDFNLAVLQNTQASDLQGNATFVVA